MFAAQRSLPAPETLADMLLGMNRPDQALHEYEVELKINPKWLNALHGAGQAAERLREPE